MYASSQALRTNPQSMFFYVGLALMLAVFLIAPQHAFASEGTGGSLPYESWLTNLRASVTVTTCKRKRSDLQSAPFSTRINCDCPARQTSVSCE